jgi:hypothetical protein
MKFDVPTIRLMSRLTDRMDLIRKYPHRYEIEPQDLADLGTSAQQVEALLAKVKTVKAG